MLLNKGPIDYAASNKHFCLQTLPPFDIRTMLSKAIADRKILITLPWLVQYLAMLDYVTIRLNYYADVVKMLYELYILTTENSIRMRPTALFIIRSSLGWIFDQPNMPDDYFVHRLNRTPSHKFHLLDNDPSGSETHIEPALSKANKSKVDVNTSQINADPTMESVLNASCPFLADFRVSIMPSRHQKTVSRTGRYRHITTKISSDSAAPASKTLKLPVELSAQTKLQEAFLHSQSLSVRRTVEFVTERTISAVIKDFQVEIILPTKRDVMKRVHSLTKADKSTLIKQLYDTFEQGQQQMMDNWTKEMPTRIRTRVSVGLIFQFKLCFIV